MSQISADLAQHRVHALLLTKEAKKLAITWRRAPEAIERENHLLLRLEKRGRKQQMAEEKKSQKDSWWADEAIGCRS